jgi:HD-GYP domain-containing protein (c-di-GMP phosphodiesterase class II)
MSIRTAVQPVEGNGVLEATVEALSGALGLRDRPTGAHCGRVERLASALGRRAGLSRRSLSDLAWAAELHDIGKVGVPDEVLLKPGPLADGEWEVLKSHASWGCDLLRKVPGLERVAVIVRHHHERFDGSGYPDGLEGNDIPIESRVLAVVDAYVAMTEDRPYRAALQTELAVEELRRNCGTQFDPMVLDAFEAELSDELWVAEVG